MSSESAKVREYKRWTVLGDDFNATCAWMREHGIEIVDAGKPGMVAWYGYRFKATSAQLHALVVYWDSVGVKSYSRKPFGAWDI